MMKTAPMLVSFGTRPAPPWRLFSRLSSPMSLMSNLSASCRHLELLHVLSRGTHCKEESTAIDARHTRWQNVKPMVAIPPRKEKSTATDAVHTRSTNLLLCLSTTQSRASSSLHLCQRVCFATNYCKSEPGYYYATHSSNTTPPWG